MSKKKVTVTLALTVGLTYSATAPSVTYAASLQSIQDQTASQQSLSGQVSTQKNALQAELDQMNQQQLKLTGQISDAQAQINITNDQISTLKDEIQVIQKRIDDRKHLLDTRLVSIYKNGGSVNVMDFLLGSKSFGDFIDRATTLNLITAQDQKIITDQKNDQNAVKEKKQSIEKKQAENVAKLAGLQKNLAEVNALQDQKKVAISALNDKQANIAKTLSDLASAAASLKTAQAAPPASPSPATPASYNSSNSNSNSNSGSSGSSPSFTLSASVSTGGVAGILNYGNQFIGRSTYVWGASSPSTGQFDCSGFVRAAFAANGISLGRTTFDQVNEGTRVSYSNAQPGDLVFFDTEGPNSHVGIYLGGGRFIGSQSSTGVAVVSMSNPYWSAHFSGVVVRILN